jgi:hypothetical protein
MRCRLHRSDQDASFEDDDDDEGELSRLCCQAEEVEGHSDASLRKDACESRALLALCLGTEDDAFRSRRFSRYAFMRGVVGSFYGDRDGTNNEQPSLSGKASWCFQLPELPFSGSV